MAINKFDDPESFSFKKESQGGVLSRSSIVMKARSRLRSFIKFLSPKAQRSDYRGEDKSGNLISSDEESKVCCALANFQDDLAKRYGSLVTFELQFCFIDRGLDIDEFEKMKGLLMSALQLSFRVIPPGKSLFFQDYSPSGDAISLYRKTEEGFVLKSLAVLLSEINLSFAEK